MRCLVVSVLLLLPGSAWADEMQPALGNLRVSAGDRGCDGPDATFCPDHAAFERLVSELGVSLATPVNGPARSLGARGLYLGVDSTATTIDSKARHWQNGTRGGDPAGLLTWSRVELRKGLPASFEVGGSIGHAIDTSLWAVGAHLRFTPLEGFYTGWGAMPDLSLRGGVMTLVGSAEVGGRVYTLDVVLSKPIVVGSAWVLSPYGGAQTLLLEFDSAQVDLTPDTGGDSENVGVFDPVRQFRWRAALGLQVRRGPLTMALAVMFDLSVPELDVDPSARAAAQLGVNLSVGATL